jgi:hemolysin activation/secretion protein
MNTTASSLLTRALGLVGLLLFAGAAPVGALAAPASSDVFVPSLTGIVVVARSQDVQQAGVSGVHGVEIRGPAFLQRADFQDLLKRHLNAPLTEASAKEIQVEIIKFCRSIDHYVVDVFYREQEITNGTIQIAVVEGKIGKILVKQEGGKWFSDSLILGDLRAKVGDSVVQSSLDQDINRLNQNTYDSLGAFTGSFRDVQSELTPGDELGEVNMNLIVNDRMPFRPFFGFDDDGIPVIGKNRLFGGFDLADLWGIDHRFTYQYTTDTSGSRYRSHLASYTMPFASGQQLTILGAYSQVDPNFSLFGPSYANLHINNGNLYQVSLRYTLDLPQAGAYRQNLTAGFDFKDISTPLFFGTSAAGLLSANKVDVGQFTLGYQSYLPDSLGSTAFSVQLVDNPGGIGSNDNSAAFAAFMSNVNARSSYLYGQIEVRRETSLPAGFSLMVRGLVQETGDTLLASETFGLGGYATVPGYEERTVTGDSGWLLQGIVRTPEFGLGNMFDVKGGRDWFQIIVFLDAGGVKQQHATQGQAGTDQLISAGAGLRLQLSDKLHARLDYGVQLKRDYLNDPGNLTTQSRGQVQFGIEASY